MNENLKIHLSIGNLILDLDGTSKTVIEQFNILKNEGLGKFSEASMPEDSKKTPVFPPNSEDTSNKPDFSQEYPSLRDIVLKQLPSSEPEWVLIYAFYCTNFGKAEFTREDILTKYDESNRKTTNRINNLSNNLKRVITKGLVRSLNNTHMLLSENGIVATKEILKRTTSSKLIQRSTSKKVESKTQAEENGTNEE